VLVTKNTNIKISVASHIDIGVSNRGMKILCGRFTFALNQNITTLSASMICYASIAYQFLTFAIASAFIFSSL